ncbi:hypothetical protein OPV22_032534 [Ensete ventricosum]|uniref:PLAT domain-containing protein n=1 Tax=Ensete ventricosum TaxID=4639 RepID=A0AAV8PRR6_ENSVE|nr:hypothetical protein OPV22_032534 [Ensete ventricosum]
MIRSNILGGSKGMAVKGTVRHRRRPKGFVGEPPYLDGFVSKLPSVAARESTFHVTFHWQVKNDVPGAVIVKNRHASEFYLKSIAFKDFAGKGRIHFVCNSWVYSVDKYKFDRVFFANTVSHQQLSLLSSRVEQVYVAAKNVRFLSN